jgi:hypothetical protein
MLAWNLPFLPWHRLQGRKGTPISPTPKVVAICGAGSRPSGLSLDANPVAIRLLGGHGSSRSLRRRFVAGTCRKAAHRLIKRGILKSQQAGQEAPRGIKAEALAEIEIAPRGLPVPSNPDQQTLQSSPVRGQTSGTLLQRGFLSRSRGRGDGGRRKSFRLIGRCIGCLAATTMPHARRPPHSVFLLCARFCAGSMKVRGDALGLRLAQSET